MKTIAKINTEIEGIKQTMAQVQNQIVEKQALIVDLKESNSKLVQLSIGKERKPASLDVQRKKINDLNSEIEELQFVQGRLDKELEQAKQELSETSIRQRLHEYAKAEAFQLALFQKAQNLLTEYVNTIAELEGSKNALELLVRINSDLHNGKRLVDFGVDLEAVLKLFSHTLLFHDFDPSRIDRLNTSNQNFLNQLDAIRQNRRSYPHAQVKRAPTVKKLPHHVDPLRQAQFYERSRLQSEDDLSMALRGRKKIIPHNHNR